MFNEEINISRHFTMNMSNRFLSCKIFVFGIYRTRIRIMCYRFEIALDFNLYLVANFCIWSSHFFINMKPSRGDNCFKIVDHFVLLFRLVLLRQYVFSVSNVFNRRLIRRSIMYAVQCCCFYCFSFCFKQDLKKLYAGDFYVM